MHAATSTAPKADGRVVPWNKGKLIGQKPPLKLKEIWAIRIRLQLDHRARELALFNLAIDSKLRGCDLVGLQVRDVFEGSHVAPRAIVMQKKTQRPVQFEITEQTRDAVGAWIAAARLKPEQFLFPSRMSASPHLSTRQYSRIVRTWAGSIGLDPLPRPAIPSTSAHRTRYAANIHQQHQEQRSTSTTVNIVIKRLLAKTTGPMPPLNAILQLNNSIDVTLNAQLRYDLVRAGRGYARNSVAIAGSG